MERILALKCCKARFRINSYPEHTEEKKPQLNFLLTLSCCLDRERMELRSFRWVCDNEHICIWSQPACRWAVGQLISACPGYQGDYHRYGAGKPKEGFPNPALYSLCESGWKSTGNLGHKLCSKTITNRGSLDPVICCSEKKKVILMGTSIYITILAPFFWCSVLY